MLLNEMEIFYYVVELKSFSNAAQRLGVSKSYISKKITKLEQELQLRLLTRSTRRLTLTEAGENFYRSCATIVCEGNEAYSMMSELQGTPAGVLKISVPPAFGLYLLAPLLPKFLAQYPDVQLDIQLENRLVDLIEEGYDLALRSAKLESSNLTAQRIYTFNSVVCATQNYLTAHGTPNIPNDLIKHNCATYSYSKDAAHLQFKKTNQEVVYVQGNVVANHLELIKQMTLNDVCIGVLPNFMVIQELREKKLQSCLSEYQLPENNLYAIYPEREFMLPKLRYFLEVLRKV